LFYKDLYHFPVSAIEEQINFLKEKK
jgi:hypothetical protein